MTVTIVFASRYLNTLYNLPAFRVMYGKNFGLQMQINAVISEIVHCADKPGVVLEGGGLQLQPLGEGGHDAFAHLRGQRVDQKRLLRADAAADQDQLRVEDVYKARKALGDLVDPAVEHSQRAGVARGGSLKNRTPVCAVPKSSVQSQYFCPEPTKGRHSHIFCAFACQILHTVFPQKNSPPPGCGGGIFMVEL